MTNEEILSRCGTNDGGYYADDVILAMDAAREDEAIRFLDSVREYERESGNRICYKERTSSEFYQLYKKQNP